METVSKKDAKKTAMLTEPMHKIIPRMAIPTIVSFLITSIYNLADTYFVSSLGTNATAAVSVNASLDQIIMMAGSLLAIGAASYISRLLGAKDEKTANRVLSVAFFIAVSFGAIVLIFGTAFLRPLVRLLGATPTCEQYSIDYATYVLLVAPFMAASFVLNQCLRAEGSALFSMFGMSFGGILNCVLDPIFIFNMGLGVKGASMATAISKIVSFSILMYPYMKRKSILKLSAKCFKPTWQMLGEIIAVGSSSMFRSGLAVVSAIILNNIAGSISDSVLAGIGVSTKVMMFPFGIVLGFGTGFQPVAGYNWGAKRYDRVMDSYRFASRVAIIGGLIMGGLFAIFATPLIHLFSATDPEMQRLGALCIRLQCIVMPLHGWVAIVNMFCSGLGRAKQAVLLSTSRQGTCFIPIVYPLAHFFGAIGVSSVQAVADLLSTFLAIPVIRGILRDVRARAIEAGQLTPVTEVR